MEENSKIEHEGAEFSEEGRFLGQGKDGKIKDSDKITPRELHLKGRDKMSEEQRKEHSKTMGDRSRSMTMLGHHGAEVEGGRLALTEKQIENARKLMERDLKRREKQAKEDVLSVIRGEDWNDLGLAREIQERWSDLHDHLYSEEKLKLALDNFQRNYKNVQEIKLDKKFEEFGVRIYKGEDPSVEDEERNTVLFTEVTCPECGCKKFFEADNNNQFGSFNLNFVRNGKVKDFTEGLYSSLKENGIHCPYCVVKGRRKE